ncbi:unnamed protein product, partial [Thlaspi arvense]
YVQNRDNLFSTLPDKVVANGGFYNVSLGNSPNRAHVLVICARGYEQQACISCVESAARGIQTNCLNRMDSFTWDKDDEDHVSCLVRSSNHTTFGKLELRPAIIYPSPLSIEPSKNITLFEHHGYMAPEYLNHGQISAKSDVYGFGVMLLEMISGKRNNSFEGEGLAAFAWKRWIEGKPETIIDPLLAVDPINEITKLIQIGLLCVQENPAKRPTMSSVIVWFGSETIIIPLPNAPAFTGSLQSQSESSTMSMSIVLTELSSR